jgi:hypothetical protein
LGDGVSVEQEGDGAMREAVNFGDDGEFGYGGLGAGVGSARVGLAMAERRVRARAGRQAPRPRASGPRPVRPAVALVGVRPAPVEWPADRLPSRPSGPRILLRRPPAPAPVVALRFRVRRAVAGVLASLVAVAVVVGLGLIADAVSVARSPEPSRSSVVPAEWSGQVLGVPGG